MNNLNEQLRENADVIYFSEIRHYTNKNNKRENLHNMVFIENFVFISQSKHDFYGFVEKIRYFGFLEYFCNFVLRNLAKFFITFFIRF